MWPICHHEVVNKNKLKRNISHSHTYTHTHTHWNLHDSVCIVHAVKSPYFVASVKCVNLTMHVCGNIVWYILPLSRYPESEYAITTIAQTSKDRVFKKEN